MIIYHVTPVTSVIRLGKRVPGWSVLDHRGMPTYPHETREEIDKRARAANARAVYYENYALARKAALGERV